VAVIDAEVLRAILFQRHYVNVFSDLPSVDYEGSQPPLVLHRLPDERFAGQAVQMHSQRHGWLAASALPDQKHDPYQIPQMKRGSILYDDLHRFHNLP
jgi:hypothetical protein